MTVAEGVRQAVQAFMVPEMDTIKAQVAEVRSVQTQMSERLNEQATQILVQRHLHQFFDLLRIVPVQAEHGWHEVSDVDAHATPPSCP